ncbi:MAG: hypothetical protein V3W41_05260 [Planctomycetota bacterium]
MNHRKCQIGVFLILALVLPLTICAQEPVRQPTSTAIEIANKRLAQAERSLRQKLPDIEEKLQAYEYKFTGRAKAVDRDAKIKSWLGGRSYRAAIHKRFKNPFERWLTAIRPSASPGAPVAQLATTAASYLKTWIQVGDPVSIRTFLEREAKQVIPQLKDADLRRSILSLVADRLCRTPGRNDLEDFLEVLHWETLFLDALPKGKPQADALTADLVLIFSDRDLDALRKSKTAYYRPGRFRDRGFHPRFQDNSDQIRHFCWALRLLARTRNKAFAAKLLDLKEHRDAKTRNLPLNQADLNLNHAAKKLITKLLAPAIKPKPSAMSLSEFAAAVQKTLGPKP